MAFGFDDIALLVGFGTNIYDAFRDRSSNVDFSKFESAINQRINRDKRAELSRVASDVRARLSSQGLGGSGVIDKAIRDEQARISSVFEDRRARELENLERFKLGIDVQGQQAESQALGGFLQGVGDLGFNIFAAQNPELFNPYFSLFNQQTNNSNTQNNFEFDTSGFGTLQDLDASRFGQDLNTVVG